MHFALLLCCLTTASLAQRAFDLQGHRGCRGLMPENTIPAFLKALDLGVTTLEMDVVISKDKQVVVSHEPYMNAAFSIAPDGKPVTKKEEKKLVLYQMNYVDIKRYDVGSNGNPAYPGQQKIRAYKPLLSDVIEQTEAYRKVKNIPAFSYSIEIKSEASAYNRSQPEPALFCDLVQAVIKQRLPADRIIIQSFDFAVLRHWKHGAEAGQYPAVRLSALVTNWRSPKKNNKKLGFKPDIYSPNFRFLSRRSIVWLHQQMINVIPWTVNKRDAMKRLKAWGVDGLITDYPDWAGDL